MNFLDWIGELIQYLGLWIPRPQFLSHTQWAVMFSNNTRFILWEKWWWFSVAILWAKRPAKVIEGGWAPWYIPALTELKIYSRLDIPMPIGTFPLLGPADVSLIVDCESFYRVLEPLTVAYQADDIEVTLGTIMTACIQSVVLSYDTCDDLSGDIGSGQAHCNLLESINEEIVDFGLVFVTTTLVVARARGLHHTGIPDARLEAN